MHHIAHRPHCSRSSVRLLDHGLEPGEAAASHHAFGFERADVRSEIMRRSACATSAIMPTIISLASGMSAATNLTPAFWSPSRKWASRLRRSSLAITRVAP